MLHKRCRWPAFAILIAAALPTLFAEPPREAPPPASDKLTRAEDKKINPPAPVPAAAPKKGDSLKLAPDAVIILGNDLPDGFKAHSVRMTPEKYQQLLDQIKSLEAKVRTEKPSLPSKCLITGKIEGDFALLQAQFEFVTEAPNTVMLLGCGPAQPLGVELDGRIGLFKGAANGFSIQVEKPGDHRLTLELMLGLTGKGNERGIEMELPRAAITNLKLTLPDNVKDVRVGGKPFTDAWLTVKNGELAGPLGPIDKLDVKWRKPGAGPNTPPVLTAIARITVQLDDRETMTRAELTLKSEGGPASVWPLLVPRGAVVKLAKEDEARLQNIGTAEQTHASMRTIRLKEAVNELHAIVTVRGSQPRAGMLTPVGPFALLNALRQAGEISVTSNLQDVTLKYYPHGDVEPAAGPGGFRYVSLTLPAQPQGTTGPGSLSLLDVEPRSTRGLVETVVLHELELKHTDTQMRVWHLRTTITANPFSTGVDHLDVLMPEKCDYVDAVGPKPANLVNKPVLDQATRVMRFTLTADPLTRFQIVFESEYQQPAAETGKATFVLPKPRDTRDRGGQVLVTVPNDLELLPPDQPSALEFIAAEPPNPQRQEWHSARLPDQVEVAWKPYRPEVQASSEVDLTLTPHQGHVRQLFRFHFPHAAPAQVTLHFPEEIADDRWRIISGGSAASMTTQGRQRLIVLTSPAGKEQNHVLKLEYTFPLPDNTENMLIPLITPERSPSGDLKVRVWTDAGLVPSLVSAAWTLLKTEPHAEDRSYAALVARALRLDAPLSLRLDHGASSSIAAVLVDRVLARVHLGDGGLQTYRVSYLLTAYGERNLPIEMPAPVPTLNLNVLLDNRQLAWETYDEADKRAVGGRIALVHLPAQAVRKPAVLEVSYKLEALRTGSGLLQTTLQPPILRGDPGRPTTRWQVTMADGPNMVLLWPDGGPGAEPRWLRRGWLFGPMLTITPLDLERWFSDGYEPPSGEDSDLAQPVMASCWRQGVEPVTIVHMPQRPWLLTCSLAFLALSLLLFLLARRSHDNRTTVANWFWGYLALLPVAVMLGLFFQPTLTSAVLYGCMPGAFVLLFAVFVQLILQERQRRQIVFLPSFRRGGSSLFRNQGSVPRHGEPSTVDAPRNNHSQWPTGEVLRTESSPGSKSS